MLDQYQNAATISSRPRTLQKVCVVEPNFSVIENIVREVLRFYWGRINNYYIQELPPIGLHVRRRPEDDVALTKERLHDVSPS